MPEGKGKKEAKADQKGMKPAKAADAFAEDNLEPDAEAKKDAPETKTQAEPAAVASYKYPVVLQGEAFSSFLEDSWADTDIKGTTERYQGMKESHIFDAAPPADNFIALDLSVGSNFNGIEDKFLSIAKCFTPVMENKMQETLAQAKKDRKEQDFFRTFQANLKVAVTDSELRRKFETYKEPEAKAHTEETKTAADTKTKTEHVDILPTYKYPDILKQDVLSDTLVTGWETPKEGAEQRFAKMEEISASSSSNSFVKMDLKSLSEGKIKQEIFSLAEIFPPGMATRIKENFEAAQQIGKAQDFAKEFQEEFEKSIANKEVKDAFAAKLAEGAEAKHGETKPEARGEKPAGAPEDLAESPENVIILTSTTATPDLALHGGEEPRLTASAPTKKDPIVDALDPGVGEVTETETERLEENKKDEEEVARLQADGMFDVPKAEAEVDPGIVKDAEEHLPPSDIGHEEEKVSSEAQETVREKTAEEASDVSTMEKFKQSLKGIWKKSADAQKNTATDKAAVSATGDDTSFTPEKDKKSKATSENKARLNLDQLKAEFLRAIREHNENSPSATVDYELVDSTKNSFNIKDKNDGGAELGTVEIKRDKSIEYTFSKPVEANFVDVVLRSSKDKVLRLHSTKPNDIEEILKAAAIAGKIIKFDDTTKAYVKKLEDSGTLDSYPTLKARVEEDAKPASQKAAELALAKSETAHPKPK